MIFSEGEAKALIVMLDGTCWSCRDLQGEAVNPSLQDDDGKCSVCDGSGYALTEAGTALLEFVRRHAQEQP